MLKYIRPLSILLLLFGLLLFVSCGSKKHQGPLLEELPATLTGITFKNNIEEGPYRHFFYWEYVYAGGGVAVGDVNNDGLQDLFFTQTFGPDALYINKGDFQFDDVSQQAGITGGSSVSAGATMIDINNDGFLDIYVCKYGPSLDSLDRRNLFFINNGDGTFTDKAKSMGLDQGGYSLQIAFFDYDKDGDLDAYLMNQPSNLRIAKAFYERDGEESYIDRYTSDRLMENDGAGKFRDVSEKAGILNFAFGLGLKVSDINHDGWDDIYVANDYYKPDFLYINQQDGTFKESIKDLTNHISYFSMGMDIGDINNDGTEDIYVVDMAGINHQRSKTNMGSMSPRVFWGMVDRGWHFQYMHNTLQVNQSNRRFVDASHLGHVAKTGWSWGTVIADLDNDGYKDIYVANGIKKDVRNNDFIESVRQQIKGGLKDGSPPNLLPYALQAPSTPLANYCFQNQGDLTFKSVAKEWGLKLKGFSNGVAAADLDNDGDLELIVNNINQPASIIKNYAVEKRNSHFISFRFKNSQLNRPLIGTHLTVYLSDGTLQTNTLYPVKGFMSSSDPLVHFGLGKTNSIDSVVIRWPDQNISVLSDLKVNQIHLLDQDKINRVRRFKPTKQTPLFAENARLSPPFNHTLTPYDDYEDQILLPYKLSEQGPCLAVADVNQDGQQDFYVGGGAGQAGVLYLQSDGQFEASSKGPWNAHKSSDDLGALFLDIDGDQDMDLYVASGGYVYTDGDKRYQDRIYINDGKGGFTYRPEALPSFSASTKAISAGDWDQDGDLDLFVGAFVEPAHYPKAPSSFFLRNDNGKFVPESAPWAKDLQNLGMVRDAVFTDLDDDKDLDLVVVGEWQPIRIFINDNGQFEDQSESMGGNTISGLWNTVFPFDFNGDGHLDLLLGNRSPNNKFKASAEHPFGVYTGDFDQNESCDVVLVGHDQGKEVPVRGRECSSQQLEYIADKFPTYEGFALATVQEIIGEDKLANAMKLEASELRNGVLINDGQGHFTFQAFPNPAQLAPINRFIVTDINLDQKPDIIGAGNLFSMEVETSRHDAGTGLIWLGKGAGEYDFFWGVQMGFDAFRDVKDMGLIFTGKGNEKGILVANNQDELQLFSLVVH